jgi:hypothetical protein
MLLQAGRSILAQAFRGDVPIASSDGLQMTLFKNDHEPEVDDDGSEYTPSTFTGYAPVDFTWGDNGVPSLVAGDYFVRFNDSDFVWDSASAGETIYGWLLWDTANGVPIAAERYEEPHVLSIGSRHTLSAEQKFGGCA